MNERPSIDRRGFVKISGAAAAAGASVLWPRVSVAAAPPAESISPELIAAATKEGKVNYYTSVDLKVAEQTAKKFEAKFPGIKVKVERSGAERNFQRIGQERASNIFNCDTINTSDAAHCIIWKREGLQRWKVTCTWRSKRIGRQAAKARPDRGSTFRPRSCCCRQRCSSCSSSCRSPGLSHTPSAAQVAPRRSPISVSSSAILHFWDH